jgi:hypothetical protein
MDLVDQLRTIANRLPGQIEHLKTEEATKMALIVPFLSALGWDVYNPVEVVPEFTADVGTKKGEKVDYAINKDGKPVILLEAKKVGVNLDVEPASQLYRYFSVTAARVGILTDGVIYRFFSDLEEPNKMDSRPFFEFDMGNVDPARVPELKRFTHEGFDIEGTISAAVELKYTRAIKSFLTQQALKPNEETVRFLAGQVYQGRLTQAVLGQFTDIAQKALTGWVNDSVAKRLQTALGEETVVEPKPTSEPVLPDGVVAIDGDIITTQEEVDAFNIVKAIVAGTLPVDRLFMRDGKTYCSVLIDNNNRKPLCRFWFNAKSTMYLGIIDENKAETKHVIRDLNGIYELANELRVSAMRFVDSA